MVTTEPFFARNKDTALPAEGTGVEEKDWYGNRAKVQPTLGPYGRNCPKFLPNGTAEQTAENPCSSNIE